MITCSDREYVQTKRIVLGQAQLEQPFPRLASWITEQFGVRVLNLVFERKGRDGLTFPRLQVILEHRAEARSFHDSDGNFDKKKQQAIATRFRELIESTPRTVLDTGRETLWRTRFETEGMLVVFSAFAPLTREEADGKVSEAEVEHLQVELANPDLWKIVRSFGHVTFMFYTEKQASDADRAGLREKYAGAYFALVRKHDEHGYLKREEYFLTFDSKENFDNNFGGNWYYYFK